MIIKLCHQSCAAKIVTLDKIAWIKPAKQPHIYMVVGRENTTPGNINTIDNIKTTYVLKRVIKFFNLKHYIKQ